MKKNVTVTFRDGVSTPDGYVGTVPRTIKACDVEFALGWVVITDQYGDTVAYPHDTIRRVDAKPVHYNRGN